MKKVPRWRLHSRYAGWLMILGFCLVAVPHFSSQIASSSGNRGTEITKETFYFPAWGKEGIQMDNVLAFALAAARKLASTVEVLKTRLRFPETFYVLDQEGLWVSFSLRIRTWKPMIEQRVLPSEWLMREGWRVLDHEWKTDRLSAQAQWPRITKALYEGDGVPFFAWYGDYKACNFHNWVNMSIPLLTTAVPRQCRYGNPMPNYKMYVTSKETNKEWEPVMQTYQKNYPWDRKIKKAVWRGSLSAANEDLQSVRWRLCALATRTNSSLLDVGLVSIPARHDDQNLDLDVVGGLVNSIPQVDFQAYTAIIDVDGNSWSSRFVELLCYNSVILKVEPQFVEYFYQNLEPWKHYIPVRYDLADLTAMANFAVDPQNEERIQEIVHNANKWCQDHLVKRQLGKDFLDILEVYTSFLDQGDAQWFSLWSEYKKGIYEHEAFDMRRIQ